jgi:hypothetical protein
VREDYYPHRKITKMILRYLRDRTRPLTYALNHANDIVRREREILRPIDLCCVDYIPVLSGSMMIGIMGGA